MSLIHVSRTRPNNVVGPGEVRIRQDSLSVNSLRMLSDGRFICLAVLCIKNYDEDVAQSVNTKFKVDDR